MPTVHYTAQNEIKVIPDLEYQGEETVQNLDLYLPLAPKPERGFPAVIVMHGGGFMGSHKARPREHQISRTLSESGYISISINYTLAPSEDEVERTMSTIVGDCKRAILWLRGVGLIYGVNPDRIGAIGPSAGGWLALCLGLTAGDGDYDSEGGWRTDIQAVVNMYSPTEPWINSISADAPPILTLHGSEDDIVSPHQAHALDQAAKRVGAHHQLIVVDGAGHSLRLFSEKRDYRPDVIQFFDAHLKA